MKSLYITSVERFSGKTATCLAIGKRLQADGFRVSYLKPLSLQPYRIDDRIADEDASFVIDTLNLQAKPWELSPVVVTREYLHDHLNEQNEKRLMDRVKAAFDAIKGNSDVVLLEGGARLREGYSLGLPTPFVAKELNSDVLMIVRYRGDVYLIDDILASKTRIGENLIGVMVNRVSKEGREFIDSVARQFLDRKGIPLFGVLPEVGTLAALTVGELVDVLDAEILTRYRNLQASVENLTIGAMTQEAALSRFRKQSNKAVITGGDRTDIQLAALETSTSCLVLTGNLRPSPLVVRQAEEFGVTILLVPTNTMETIERIENIYGKTRLGQAAKLQRFERLMEENFDFARLYSVLELK